MANKQNRPSSVGVAFETELFVVSAASRRALAQRAVELSALPGHGTGLALQDVARTLTHSYTPDSTCLSVVASSREDLCGKLAFAADCLRDASCTALNEKSGIYYFEEKLALDRGVAFLFPGEGAQYPNMLLDLCVHFPEARRAFDAMDKACHAGGDGFVPSAWVFPCSAEAAGIEELGIEGAVQVVLGANDALLRICRALGMRPRAVVGHSCGEFTALEAAGVLRPDDEAGKISVWADIYGTMKRFGVDPDVPGATLLAVGGIARTEIEQVIERFSPGLCLAMRNCPQQHVLCASEDILEAAMKELVSAGAICIRMPYERSYHTSDFESAVAWMKDSFGHWNIRSPELPLYSCMTSKRFPSDRRRIRELAANQWSNPVLFQETVESMYDDGIRCFLEVGPRGNLCSFVSNTLKGRPHMAIPINVPHRPGIEQLQHALGVLAAHGADMDLEYLHRHRGSDLVDIGAEAPAARGDPLRTQVPVLEAGAIAQWRTAAHVSGAHTIERPGAVLSSDGADMIAYLDGLQRVVEEEAPRVARFFRRSRAGKLTGESAAACETDGPLAARILEIVPFRSLTAIRELDIEEETFLKDHTLGGKVSAAHPDQIGLPVMPLVMSLETAAEASLALAPGKVVTGIDNVRAHRWITFEKGRASLRVTAERRDHGEEIRVSVEVREADPDRERRSIRYPAVEAVVVLSDEYAPESAGEVADPGNAEPCDWTNESIYPHLSFHGPCFQGVRSVSAVAGSRLAGTLEVMPRNGLFKSCADPVMAFDPALLDAMGQAVGLWARRRDGDAGRAYLPFRIGSVRFHSAPLPEGASLDLEADVGRHGKGAVTGNVRAVSPGGAVHMTVAAWEDRAFDASPRLIRLWLAPLDNYLSEEWELVGKDATAGDRPFLISAIEGIPFDLFEGSHGIWGKVLAFIALNREEREQWLADRRPAARRVLWLLGRVAAKEALRRRAARAGGAWPGMADFAIRVDEQGKPYVFDGTRTGRGTADPISIAHTEGLVTAVAGRDGVDAPIGVDTERVRDFSADAVAGAFSDADLAHLAGPGMGRDEWLTRGWCAKEALAKALGAGLAFDAGGLAIRSADADTGRIEFSLHDAWQQAFPRAASQRVGAHTWRRGDHVIAICELDEGNGDEQ